MQLLDGNGGLTNHEQSACRSHSHRFALRGKSALFGRPTQNRWPVGASITAQVLWRSTKRAPSSSRRATSASTSSVSILGEMRGTGPPAAPGEGRKVVGPPQRWWIPLAFYACRDGRSSTWTVSPDPAGGADDVEISDGLPAGDEVQVEHFAPDLGGHTSSPLARGSTWTSSP